MQWSMYEDLMEIIHSTVSAIEFSFKPDVVNKTEEIVNYNYNM